MPTRAVYGSCVEWAGWEASAAAAGESVNGWVRRALNEQLALERVLAREGEEVRDGEVDREGA